MVQCLLGAFPTNAVSAVSDWMAYHLDISDHLASFHPPTALCATAPESGTDGMDAQLPPSRLNDIVPTPTNGRGRAYRSSHQKSSFDLPVA